MASPLGQWPAWREPFLEALAATGNVTASARAVGLDRDAAYLRRKSDPEFAAAWASAEEVSTDELVAEARRRALAGSDWLLWRLIQAHRRELYGDTIRIDIRQEAERIAAEVGIDVESAIAEAERILEGR